jgi:NADPH:quinone reductase-like Zn-dependent oxidoreductase
VPLPAMTAALGIYQTLGLTAPWQPAKTPHPLIVYGGASAVGAYAIKFASLSNIHPIIAVAGAGIPFVETLLDPSKGDVVVDYRKGQEHVVAELRKAAGNTAMHAFDAISEKGSITAIAKVLQQNGQIATVLTPEMVLQGSSLSLLPSIKIRLTELGLAIGSSVQCSFRTSEWGLPMGGSVVIRTKSLKGASVACKRLSICWRTARYLRRSLLSALVLFDSRTNS